MTAKTANIFSGSCTLNPAFARSRRIFFLCVAFALLNKALDAPEAGPVFPSSQVKYRFHRYILVFFGFRRHLSKRDFSGSGQNGKVGAPPPPLLSLRSHFFFPRKSSSEAPPWR